MLEINDSTHKQQNKQKKPTIIINHELNLPADEKSDNKQNRFDISGKLRATLSIDA